MERLKVVIFNKQKKVKVPSGLRMLIRRCCHAVLVNEGYKGRFEVSVSFIDNEQIKELNNEYRNRDIETDVLSFPLGQDGKFDVNPENGTKMLGDVVMSLEKAVSQAASYGHSLQREVAYLTVHSMLHLIGYDHEQGGIEALKMRELEEIILATLGLSRAESYVIGEDE